MSLEPILRRPDVWRGNHAPAMDVIASGYAELDRLLPGGWPRGALTEIHLPLEGVGELRLLLPALARLSHGEGFLALIAPPYVPYAPALAAAGVHLSRLLLVHPRTRADHLWAIESGLRSGACAAVLAWTAEVTAAYLRRWQLAAEIGKAWGVLFQRHLIADSPAALRLRLLPEGKGALTVNVLKRRGGWPMGPVRLEIDHAVALRTSPGSGARGMQSRRAP
jgi:hypothetical protein